MNKWPKELLLFINLMLIGVVVGLGFSSNIGCAAPRGVVDAAEDLAVPVGALADRYAALVDSLAITDAEKLPLLEEAAEDLQQFEELHEPLLEYLKGRGLLTKDTALEYYDLVSELKKRLGKEDP